MMMMLFTVTSLMLLCACVSALEFPAALDLIWIPNALQQGVVCNDGSPYGYYFKKGDPNKWVFHFQGGGWCWDEGSCASRFNISNQLMSSKQWTQKHHASGLFDLDPFHNPDWHDATRVYLPYCTSDSFSGNLSASPSTFGWSFVGKVVLRAVLDHLIPQGLGAAELILVSGCSAGGAAVVANVDYVAAILPPLPTRVIKGHVDAGWFMLATPFSAVPVNMQGILELGAKLWGGIPNAACAATYSYNPSMCYMGEFALPYFTVPVLVHQESEDFPQLLINGLNYPWSTAGVAWENEWRANLTASLKQLQAPNAAFSPACYWHCVTEDHTFWDLTITGDDISDRDALHDFFFKNQPGQWIDGCSGFSCSNHCPNVTTQSF